MAKLIAIYKKPQDPGAFDRYYYGTHVPLAKLVPGLRSYQVSVGGVGSAAGDSPYHLIAELGFDSMVALQQALGSAQGQAAAGDLANFAQAGVELLIVDTKEI